MKAFILSIITVAFSISMQAQPFKIATGEPLRSQQQELKVHGRTGILIRQKMDFGSYRTTMVRRSGVSSWKGITGFPGTIWTEHIQGRESIHFRLTNDRDTSDVMAVSRVKSTDLLIGTAPGSKRLPGSIAALYKNSDIYQNNYSVAIATRRGEEPWELFLDNSDAQLRREDPAGYMVRGDDYYTIETVWQLEKKDGSVADIPFGSVGFKITDKDNRVMAAVSLIDKGKVYLGPGSEEERFLLANACAALLLQTNISM